MLILNYQYFEQYERFYADWRNYKTLAEYTEKKDNNRMLILKPELTLPFWNTLK
jgi:hypothetical protein